MIRAFAIFLILGAVPSQATAAQAQGQPAAGDGAAIFARAIALHQAGDLVGAIDAYREVLRLVPESAGIRSNLGAALSRLGRYDEAIQEYRLALRSDEGNADFRFNLALALYKSVRLAEAAAEFERVLGTQAHGGKATLLLADCQLQLGETRKVIDLLSPREAEFADDDAFAYLLGTALIEEDDLTRGQAVIDRLLRKGSAEAHLLMAAAHIKAKDFEHAGEELQRARQLNPRLPGLNYMQGQCLMGSRDWEGAARAFRAELDVNPNHFEACLMLGTLRKDEGRYDDALQYLKRANTMRSHDTRAMYSLAGIHIANGNFEEARQLLEEVARLVPDNEQTHVALATVYFRLGRPQDAERERTLVRKLNEASVARARAETEVAQKARQEAEGAGAHAVPTPSPR